jgi:hypothetical protein
VRPEILEQNLVRPQVTPHPLGVGNRAQRAPESQPVKPAKCPRDLVLLFRDKLVHGVSASLWMDGGGKPISYETRNAINVWLRLRRAVLDHN